MKLPRWKLDTHAPNILSAAPDAEPLCIKKREMAMRLPPPCKISWIFACVTCTSCKVLLRDKPGLANQIASRRQTTIRGA